MKKLNIDKGFVKLTLSVALLLSQTGVGDIYDDYNKSTASEIGKVDSAFSSVTRPDGLLSADSLADQLKKNQEKVDKKFEQSNTETEQRVKLRNWVQKNDTIKNLIAAPDLILQKAIKNRQLDVDKADALASQLGQNSTPVNPGDFSTGNLPKACRSKVDFTQLTGLMDKMNTEPGQYLKKQTQSLLSDKREELKNSNLQKIADVMKYFKELSLKDDNVEVLKSDGVKGDAGVEARIQELKAKNKEQKDQNKSLKTDLVDTTAKFIGQLSTIKANDKRIQQLGGEFTKMLDDMRRNAMLAAQEQTDQLLANCENEIRNLQRDIIASTEYMIRAGINAEVAQADTQAQLQRAAQLQCEDVGQQVQGLIQQGFGASRKAAIASAKNPVELMSLATLALQDAGNTQSEVGKALHPVMDDCEDAANAREAVKQRMQPIAGSQQNTAQQASGGSVGRAASAIGNGIRNGVNSIAQGVHSVGSRFGSSGRR